MNRVSEFKNFSDHGVPKDKTVLCAEVTMKHSHDNIIEKVIHTLDSVGFIQKEKVIDSLLLNEKFGYPIYNRNYEDQLAVAKDKIEGYSNLFLVGRNATFTHMDIDDNFESAKDLRDNLLHMHATGKIRPLTLAGV